MVAPVRPRIVSTGKRATGRGELPASRVRSCLPTRTLLHVLLDSSEEQGTACCAHKDSRAVHPDTVMKGCVGPGPQESPPSLNLGFPTSEVSLIAPPAPCGAHIAARARCSVQAPSGGRRASSSYLKGGKDPASLHATPKSSPTRRVPSRGTPRVPEPLSLSPFYPPDRDRRVDSPAWSGRGSRPSRRTSG